MTIEYDGIVIKLDSEKELDKLDSVLKTIKSNRKVTLKSEVYMELYNLTRFFTGIRERKHNRCLEGNSCRLLNLDSYFLMQQRKTIN
ncbi:hypothetical protein [Clostridium hydrogenum]|uniref:hypothetical protein n=1 Tax=Clostridium hydrogenum TaxID=2855764 RepID=UPI001F3905CA|nr:hypothetical protein [Clostridium hydrogenum]